MPVDPKNKPSYRNKASTYLCGPIKIVRDVSGGTAKMRFAGATYLPQEPAELPEDYACRLSRSVFFNAYRKTREALVGMVFKDNPELDEDIPDKIKSQLENIDLAGTHIDVFAKELFTDAFEGHAFILVEMEKSLPAGSTLADEKAAGLRPYWVRYKADQAVNWKTARVNGEQVLTQITFEECTYESSGEYGEEEVTRYRVFRLPYGPDGFGFVQWELWRKVKDENGEEQLVSDGDGVTTLTRIPVAVVYGRRLGEFISEPPLIDLAHLNIAHYQEYSDYRNILHVANVPILVRKGATEDQIKSSIRVSGNCLFDVPSDGDLSYAEHQGKAIGAARTEMVDLEQRMAMLGVSILSQRSDSNITATEKKMDANERSSELSTMARSLQDAMEQALMFHAQYIKLPEGGSIKLGVSEGDLILDGSTITALSQAVDTRKLSLDTFLNIMQRGFPGIDFTDEAANIAAGGLPAVRTAAQNSTPAIRALYQARPNGQQPTL